MFNRRAPLLEVSSRELVFRQALAAAFESQRQILPQAPASLPALLAGTHIGVYALLGKPGCRDALGEIRARLFHTSGREPEGQVCWQESLASAIFAARVAQLTQAAVSASFLGALIHRCGEALALKILARVELAYRMKLDSASRRDWCAAHAAELAARLVRTWNLSPQIATCVLGWNRFGGLPRVSPETTAVYFGRLFAIELLQPQFCVPGALDHAAAELGLTAEHVAQIRREEVRPLLRALD